MDTGDKPARFRISRLPQMQPASLFESITRGIISGCCQGGETRSHRYPIWPRYPRGVIRKDP